MSELATLQDLIRNLPDRAEKECLVQFEDQDVRRFTYAEMHETVERLAKGLVGRNIGAGKRVGIIAENRYQSVFISLAVIYCGATVIPIDPQFDEANLKHVLSDGSPVLLFASQGQAERVKRLDLAEKPDILFTDLEEDEERSWLLEPNQSADLPPSDPRSIAVLFYTSGTTGSPKGVPLSHANLVFQQNALISAGLVAENDRVLLPLPLHHVYPFAVGMLAPLALGLTLILPRALTGTELARAIHDGSATLIVGVPRLYEALVSAIDSRLAAAGFIARTIGSAAMQVCMFCRKRLGLRTGKLLLGKLHRGFGRQLNVLASGGAPLDPDLAWRLEAFGWKVAIGYGLTETSPILTINPPGSGRMASVGKALEGIRIRIAEPAKQAAGEAGGEILAKGPGVFEGYHDLDEKSRDAFTADGWFKTGDLGRLEEGWLRVTGRVSTMIVTRSGENIQPDELEKAIETHHHIKEAGVVEHDGRIAALVVPHTANIRAEGAQVEEAVRRGVDEAVSHLPSYMHPTEVVISSNPIQRTRLGKIMRHKLRAHVLGARNGEGDGSAPLPPERMDPADRELLEDPAADALWQMLTERFAKHGLTPDSRLQSDLGVDSLGWLDLSMDIRGRIGVELDEKTIAGIESVRDLLRKVRNGSGRAEEKGGDPLENPEAYLEEVDKRWLSPLSPWQRRLGRLLRQVIRLFCLAWLRTEARGTGNISREKQVVFAPNHASLLDPFVLAACLPYCVLKNTQFAGHADVAFANGFTAFFSRLARAFPVDPSRKPGTGLAFGGEVLKMDRNLIWFPEGARSRTGRLGAFLPGLGMILARHPCLVQPVYIHGSRLAMPPGSPLIRPCKVTVHFAEAIASEELEREGEGETPHDRITTALKKRIEDLEKQYRKEQNDSRCDS